MSPAERYQAGVETSAQILRAAGVDLVPLREPIGKVFDFLGVAPNGLLLVTVVLDWPNPLGLQRLGAPPRWPAHTLRMVHRYNEESPWPEVRYLD